MKKPEGSGIQKGQKTKRALETHETFQRIVEKYGDPLMALAEMAFDTDIDLAIRQNSMRELCTYGYAKRKALEISGPNGDPLTVDVRLQLIGQITEAFEKLASKK